MLNGVHGSDETEVYRELSQAVGEWMETCRENGVPLPEATAGREYSGRFVLRVGSDLHKTLAIGALRRNESLNTYCVNLLRENTTPYGEKVNAGVPLPDHVLPGNSVPTATRSQVRT